MRVLLDANVVIAAFAAHGLCAEIFRRVLDRHTFVVSEQLLIEIERNLVKKLKLSPSRTARVTKFLKEHALLVSPAPVSVEACSDKSDLHVLGAAHAAGVEFIVTGDADLSVLKHYKGIPILSPREAWGRLDG